MKKMIKYWWDYEWESPSVVHLVIESSEGKLNFRPKTLDEAESIIRDLQSGRKTKKDFE